MLIDFNFPKSVSTLKSKRDNRSFSVLLQTLQTYVLELLLLDGSESQRVRDEISDFLTDFSVLLRSLRGVLKTSFSASETFLVSCSFLPEDLVNGII